LQKNPYILQFNYIIHNPYINSKICGILILRKVRDMKVYIKKITFILVLLLGFALVGCNREAPQAQVGEELTLNAGIAHSKYVEDDKNYIEISIDGGDLKLQVEDDTLFDSLMEDEFYLFAYNKDNVIKDIEVNSYLKDLVLDSMKQPVDDDMELQGIKAQDPVSTDDLTLLDEYIIDFNQDGFEERISMYVSAGRDESGEIMWDDGQRWLLVVHGDGKDFVLFDDYVQLGTIHFNVLTEEDDFYITTISSRTANFAVTQYEYHKEQDLFIQRTPIAIEGNVNMLHSSSGY